MATCGEERGINECPVCMEVFECPMLLPCHHTLCKHCLDRITFDEVANCPLCNEVCSRDDAKPDFRLSQFLDILRQKNQEILRSSIDPDSVKYPCQLCEVNIFAFWCENCELWICERCKKNHGKSKAMNYLGVNLFSF